MRRGREVFVDPSSFEWDPSTLLDDLGAEDMPRPLLDLIDRMDEPMKSVVEMVGFGQQGKVETARQLGLSRQWVQRLWRQARLEIIGALQEEA